MSSATRLVVFGAVLAVLFSAAAAAGGALDPDAADPEPAEAMAGAAHGGGEPEGGAAHAGPAKVHGLAVSDAGLRLDVRTPELRRGRAQELAFRVLNEQGEPVRDYDVEHERRMHLIVVRRDLTGFQHLHPELRPDGTWVAPITLPDAGSYRVFADFSHDGTATTLAGDLRVDGPADLRPLPAPAATAPAGDGYAVELGTGTAHAGDEAELRFTVTRDGRPVETEPYLGAGGHLVALREGDLAFLHVHPADGLGFMATFPSPGRYRLFLQFRHEGVVRTAAFTQAVAR
ncbi:MAG TPA: hypothetical protein VD836_14995 [Solirubrobacteraceae bacterium]|nr:hypothetical protein [Solirubrobacteraceae bacterium]